MWEGDDPPRTMAAAVGTALERLPPEARTARRFTEMLAALRFTWRITVRAPSSGPPVVL